jgi:hypothetical protein
MLVLTNYPYNKILLKGFLCFLQNLPERFNEAGDICPMPVAEIRTATYRSGGGIFLPRYNIYSKNSMNTLLDRSMPSSVSLK